MPSLRPSIGLLLLLAPCGADFAADWGGGLAVTTNYVYRGLSHTGHDPALQGDLYVRTLDGWFAGVWGSFAEPQSFGEARSELNFYLGRGWRLTPDWTLAASYVRYLYPDSRRYGAYNYDYEYGELQARASFRERLTLSFGLSPEITRYSPTRYRSSEGRQWSYEGAWRQPLWGDLNLVAGLGYYDLRDLFDESYWALSGGLQLGVRHGLQFNLMYFGVDEEARRLFGRQSADGRLTLTGAWRF